MSQEKFPVIFVTHGAGPLMFLEYPPMNILGGVDKNSPAAHWFRQLSKQLNLSSKPKCILVISAHWETNETVEISSQEKHTDLYYDYYNAPAESYQIKYQPKGDQNLSKKILNLLENNGIKAKLNKQRNFDHGVFIPLKLIYPDADIPVVSMSILDDLSPSKHFQIGKALRSLRDEGVLIIGSGSTVHGSRVNQNQSNQFTNKLIEVLTNNDVQQRDETLINWEKSLPFARLNHPREEHFVPLFVVLGAANSDRGQLLNPDVPSSQSAFRFG